MAREAGDCFTDERGREEFIFDCYGVERLAALVAAAEREEMKLDGVHTCHDQCQRPACVAIREAVAAEREACAKALDAIAEMIRTVSHETFVFKTVTECAAVIRERGQV